MGNGPKTPVELAVELGVEPSCLRRFLRTLFPRSEPEQGQRWTLTAEMTGAARAHFDGTRRNTDFNDDRVVEVVGSVENGHLVESDGLTDHAVRLLDTLAVWSAWVPFAEALAVAPKLPGVYMAREAATGTIAYVGMAGERRGNGLRGRLAVYSSGRALASGLGEAVFDRALADGDWLRQRLAAADAGTPARAKQWGRLAIERAHLEVRWATVVDRASAEALERSCLDALASTSLWNRLR